MKEKLDDIVAVAIFISAIIAAVFNIWNGRKSNTPREPPQHSNLSLDDYRDSDLEQ